MKLMCIVLSWVMNLYSVEIFLMLLFSNLLFPYLCLAENSTLLPRLGADRAGFRYHTNTT